MKRVLQQSLFFLSLVMGCAWGIPPQITISDLENYLNGIHTLQARMTQISTDHRSLSGKIYMDKTTGGNYGKLKIEYDQEDQDTILSDGHHLILYTPLSEEQTPYPVEETPATFLLQKKIKLEDGFIVKSFTQEQGQITLELMVNRLGAGDASVTLSFSITPLLKLKGWTIIDPQGNKTSTDLKDVVIGVKIPSSVFSFQSRG